MKPIDVMLVQAALRNVERALISLSREAAAFDLDVFKARLDLISAKGDLRAALVGNVEAKETVSYGPDEAPF